MINHNEILVASDSPLFKAGNRAFQYGDQLFETIRVSNGQLVFWDDHYFRMMGGACMLRMEIPMHFNQDFFEEEIQKTLEASNLKGANAKVRLNLYRNSGGLYRPTDRGISFLIEVFELDSDKFELNKEGLNIDVFTDHSKPNHALSNIKGLNSIVSVLAGIFAQEHQLDDVLLLNDKGFVAEAISSNVFLVKASTLITPPESAACVSGIIRKNIIENADRWGYTIEEKDFKSFDLIKADEVFLTNSVKGVCWVSNYKKKAFAQKVSLDICAKLNELI